MKFHLSSTKLKPLNGRGMSHLMVPLVIVLTIAVGGTFMMVSSKAETPPNPGGLSAPAELAATDKKKNKKPKIDPNTSKLLIYSAAGTFKDGSVKVVTGPKDGKVVAAKCGRAPKAVNGVIKKTPAMKKNKFNFSDKKDSKGVYYPIILVCQDPVAGNDLSVIYSSKKMNKAKFSFTPVSLTGRKNECVFVHVKSVSDRQVSFAGGDCKNKSFLSKASVDVTEADPPLAADDPARLAD